jgi:hypothetical protein
MLISIFIIFCLFNCHLNRHHVNASSVPHIEQDTRELGMRMSLLYRSQCLYESLGFKQAITDVMKKMDDLATSKYLRNKINS